MTGTAVPFANRKTGKHHYVALFLNLQRKGYIYSPGGGSFYENLFIFMFFPVFCRTFSNIFFEFDMEIIDIPVTDFFCDRINF